MILFFLFIIITLGLTSFFDYLIYINLGPAYIWIGLFLVIPTFFVLIGLFIVFLAIWSLFLSDKYKPNRPSRFYYKLIRNFIYVIFRLFRIKVHQVNEEIISGIKNALFVSNHVSDFDPMLLIWLLKNQALVCVSKPQNFRVPIGGKFIRYTGFISVDRENPREAISAIKKACDVITNKYGSVYIAPEGTRNKTDNLLLPMHAGSFKIAVETKAPIVIVSIRQTKDITQKFFFTSKDVYVDYLKVLTYEEYKDLDTIEIKDIAEKLILENLKTK